MIMKRISNLASSLAEWKDLVDPFGLRDELGYIPMSSPVNAAAAKLEWEMTTELVKGDIISYLTCILNDLKQYCKEEQRYYEEWGMAKRLIVQIKKVIELIYGIEEDN